MGLKGMRERDAGAKREVEGLSRRQEEKRWVEGKKKLREGREETRDRNGEREVRG